MQFCLHFTVFRFARLPSTEKKNYCTKLACMAMVRLIYGFIFIWFEKHLLNHFKLNGKVLMAFLTLMVKNWEKLRHVLKLNVLIVCICKNQKQKKKNEWMREKERDESQKSYRNCYHHHQHHHSMPQNFQMINTFKRQNTLNTNIIIQLKFNRITFMGQALCVHVKCVRLNLIRLSRSSDNNICVRNIWWYSRFVCSHSVTLTPSLVHASIYMECYCYCSCSLPLKFVSHHLLRSDMTFALWHAL